MLALGITGTVLIEQEFDPLWFISEDSYANDYFDADDKYFPSDGFSSGHVYIGMFIAQFWGRKGGKWSNSRKSVL